MWRPVLFACSPTMQQRECKGTKKNWSSLFPHVTFFLRLVKYAHFWASLAVGHVFSVSHKKRRQIKSLYLPSKRSLIGSFFPRTYKDCLERSFASDATNTKLRFYSVFVSIKKEWKQYCSWHLRGVRRRMKIRIQFLMCVSICAQLLPSHFVEGCRGVVNVSFAHERLTPHPCPSLEMGLLFIHSCISNTIGKECNAFNG